jgi:predicted transcriptional regulator
MPEATGIIGGNPILVLVALFVYLGASAENNATQVHFLAQRLKVSDAMITQFTTLPVTSRIGDAASVLIHSTQHDIPIVDGVGKMIGLLTRNQILHALHVHGRDFPVADVMRTDLPTISDRTDINEALALMDKRQLPAIAVADSRGSLIGMVTLENLGQMLLLGFLRPAE